MGVIEARRRILLSAPHVEATTPAGVANFQTDLISPLRSLKAGFLPVQSGSGDPSPSNVRAITGWSGLTVYKAGVSVLSAEFSSGVLNLITGEVSTNNSWIISGFIPVSPLTTYYFKCPTVSSYSLDIAYYDKNKSYLGNTDADGYSSCNTPGRSRKTPADCYFVRIQTKNASYNNDISINYPSTDTSYHPYTGTTIPVTFPAAAGTVYGGYVDLVRGEVVAEWGVIEKTWGDFGNKTVLGDNTRGLLSIASQPSAGTGSGAMCNVAPRDTSWSGDTVHFYTNEGSCIVILPNSTSQSTDIQIVYPIATPIHYPLTPQIVKSLRGTNNIWSDANGDVSVEYWKH